MTWWMWALVGVAADLVVTGLVLLLVKGGEMADRVEAPRVRVQERRPR